MPRLYVKDDGATDSFNLHISTRLDLWGILRMKFASSDELRTRNCDSGTSPWVILLRNCAFILSVNNITE